MGGGAAQGGGVVDGLGPCFVFVSGCGGEGRGGACARRADEASHGGGGEREGKRKGGWGSPAFCFPLAARGDGMPNIF